MYTYKHFITDPNLLNSLKTKGDRTKKTIKLTCNHCEIEYMTCRNTIKTAIDNKATSNFCHMDCLNRSRRQRVNVTCKHCSNVFTKQPSDVSENGNDFCNSSCSAIYSNKHRERPIRKPIEKKVIVVEKYPYSTAYLNVCKKSGVRFYHKSYRKFHPDLSIEKDDYYESCKFRFAICQFPEWFDGKLIEENGWYSTPGSRNGILNTNGVSRDHLVSVSYGFINNIAPKIIRHPANCDLKLHKDNQKKYNKCSVSLNQLQERIEKFEELYPDWLASAPKI